MSTISLQRVAIPERYSNVFKDTFQPVCSASAFPFAFKIRLPVESFSPSLTSDNISHPSFVKIFPASPAPAITPSVLV